MPRDYFSMSLAFCNYIIDRENVSTLRNVLEFLALNIDPLMSVYFKCKKSEE